MPKPLLHSRSKMLIDNFLSNPSHGLLLTGSSGIGKRYLATWMAKQLAHEVSLIESEIDKKLIGIDQIKNLYEITRTDRSQAVVIVNAQQMSQEAQNAFLKLLEEPTKDTYFVLTVEHSSQLLPTITSRLQSIDIVKPLRSNFLDFFIDDETNQQRIMRLLPTISGPGQLSYLLSDELILSKHLELLELVKKFYSGSASTRLAIIAEHNYDKEYIIKFLEILSLIIKSLLESVKDAAKINKLLKQADLIEDVTFSMKQINGNTKIHCVNLILNL